MSLTNVCVTLIFFQLGSSNTSDTWWSPPPRVDTGGKKTTSVWFRKTSSYQNRLEMNFRVLALFLGSPYISTPSQATSLFPCADHNGSLMLFLLYLNLAFLVSSVTKKNVKSHNESEIRHLFRNNGSPHSPRPHWNSPRKHDSVNEQTHFPRVIYLKHWPSLGTGGQ